MAQAQEQGLVTPEAVVLQFETANVGSRCLAILIDLLIQGTLLFASFLGTAALVSTADAGGAVAVSLLFVVSFLLLFGYPVAFEVLWRGRTPGKAAMGLRVVTKEGAPVRFRHAAIRGALQLIDLWVTSGGAAVLSILLTRHSQRLGDLAAGTIVRRERSGTGAPTSVRFPVPYGYESYAASLDVSSLTGPEYTAVRSFLLRAGSLSPEVRWSVAAQLATPLAAKLHHEPPPGVSPELFLACLAAGYQRRYESLGPVAAPAWTAQAPPPPQQWGTAPSTEPAQPVDPAAPPPPVERPPAHPAAGDDTRDDGFEPPG